MLIYPIIPPRIEDKVRGREKYRNPRKEKQLSLQVFLSLSKGSDRGNKKYVMWNGGGKNKGNQKVKGKSKKGNRGTYLVKTKLN
jgi:hypothetical protein